MNIQVPFLFKYAVDYLNNAPLVISDAETAVISLATIFILGCKLYLLQLSMNTHCSLLSILAIERGGRNSHHVEHMFNCLLSADYECL